MAKQAVGPIIRYLDKAVLVLCGGAFLFVVAVYGLVSPIKVGPEGQEQYGPGDIDPQIKVEAERLREKLRDSDPPEIDPNEKFERPDLSGMDDVRSMAGVGGSIASPVPPGLPVPKRKGEVEQRKINLVDVVPIARPSVVVGRSGLYLQPPRKFSGGSRPKSDNASFLQDSNWATVYVSFNREEQEKLFAAAGYAGEQADAVFLGIDVERRMQQPGGEWSDWAPVNTTRTMEQPSQSNPDVFQADKGLFAVSDDDREEVDLFAKLITTGENNEAQCDLQRPLFPDIAYGDPWYYPLNDGDTLAKDLDAEIQKSPNCRYPECTGADAVDTKLEFDELIKNAEKALDEGQLENALKYAEAARDNAERDGEDRDASKAGRLIDEINREQARADQERSRVDRLPTQLLWAHDAGIGSLQSGRTYQYRVRAELFNPYCGRPTLLNDPQQASAVAQLSPWSEPSDPVSIEPDTVIFVKSAKTSKLEVKVEVFKWFTGEWFSRQFNIKVGDAIGEPKKITTPRGKELVDFSTGATVVDIDFLRQALLPNRKGNKLENTSTTALVYVDASGNLHENLLAFDKNSTTYKRFRGIAWDE